MRAPPPKRPNQARGTQQGGPPRHGERPHDRHDNRPEKRQESRQGGHGGSPSGGSPSGASRPGASPSGASPSGASRPGASPPGATPPGRGPRPQHGRGEPRTPRAPQSGSAAPRGAVWLYGAHAVAAALANPARRLRRLVLTEEAEAALKARLPPPWAIAGERLERSRIDQLLGRDAVHQGIALLADPLAAPPLQAALERPGPILVLDQVSDPRNIGAIIRSAAAFGAAAIIMQDRNAPEETGALAKAASGALESVPLLRAVNIARTLIALKAAGLWTVGLAAGAPALSGPALGERRIAIVLGEEGEGLRRLTRETCDELAGLPMPGTMESLNVSAAAAVALYELHRR